MLSMHSEQLTSTLAVLELESTGSLGSIVLYSYYGLDCTIIELIANIHTHRIPTLFCSFSAVQEQGPP